MCWEDSDVDRALLSIGTDSKVLMITSAGCNALNYLLDQPSSVECVDINPRQNALLSLKLALIRNTNHSTFFRFFAEGKHPDFEIVYKQIRSDLPDFARNYWDRHIDYFDPSGQGFFYQGGAGYFARFLRSFFRKQHRSDRLSVLLKEPFKENRAQIYKSLEAELFSGIRSWIWKKPALLALAGIPSQQINAIGNLDVFIKQSLENVFVQQNPAGNYFWKAYLNGSYSADCSPDYLNEQYFDCLKERADRIELFTQTLEERLQESSEIYSHLVLLDHMDWLAESDPDELTRTWKAIFRHTSAGSRVLFRTAYRDTRFLPGFVHEKINLWQPDPDFIAEKDKVGTYTATWVAEIL